MGNSTARDHWPAPQAEAETQLLRRADLSLSTAWEQPRTESELKLAGIWQQVLGVDGIGASDDFFELGGDSFAATTLAVEIEVTFGLRFAPSDIIDLSTVAKQAQAIAAKAAQVAPQLPSPLIPGSTSGSKPPVFMVHGGSGFAFLQPVFVDIVGEDRPVYFFQAPGLDGRATPLNKVEDIARLYVQSMCAIQPAGPYNIVAMCAGSFIALEMCNQIEEGGETVGRLILLDPNTMPPAKKKKWARPETSLGDETALDRIPPEKRAHVTESMVKVVQELHEAIRKYVPRPYSGKAAVLVNSKKMHKIVGKSAFWPSHLGDMEYHVGGATHDEVFHTNLAETARFVRDALAS